MALLSSFCVSLRWLACLAICTLSGYFSVWCLREETLNLNKHQMFSSAHLQLPSQEQMKLFTCSELLWRCQNEDREAGSWMGGGGGLCWGKKEGKGVINVSKTQSFSLKANALLIIFLFQEIKWYSSCLPFCACPSVTQASLCEL